MERLLWQALKENASLKIALADLTIMTASERRAQAQQALRDLGPEWVPPTVQEPTAPTVAEG